MIILDTNVLSALMRQAPDPVATAWLDRQQADAVWITSVTVFEARHGLSLLPKGRRRTALEAAFARVVAEDLENRVLDFDNAAAVAAADLASTRHRAGRPVDFRDMQIAGIALARHAAIATANERHFAGLDVPVINPWAR